MKVGGNQSATDFFTKHGGQSLLNDADTKKRYSSRVAELYKEELAKRVREDTAKYVSCIPILPLSKIELDGQIPAGYIR